MLFFIIDTLRVLPLQIYRWRIIFGELYEACHPPTAFPGDPCIDNPATLGAAIRAARTQAGLRQVDAASSIGVALQTLIDIETGQPGVSIGKILQVARGLGVTLFVLP